MAFLSAFDPSTVSFNLRQRVCVFYVISPLTEVRFVGKVPF